MKYSYPLMQLSLVILLLCSLNLSAQFANPIAIESNTNLITNITTADLNNDSILDIIVTKKFSQNSLISYYLGVDHFSFGPETVVDSGSSQVTNIALGDFNNDQWIDIVSIGDVDNSIKLYLNNSLTFSSTVLDSFAFFVSDIAVADIDADNHLDIVAVGGTTMKVLYNDGSAIFSIQNITTPIEDFFDITVADIDGDSLPDVITGGSNLSVYKNNNGVISYDSQRSSQIGQTPSTFNLFVRLADIDNDGHLDLFTEGNNSTDAQWFENDGAGNFIEMHVIDSSVTHIRSGALQDFDQDGDIDIMIVYDFDLFIYLNDGFGNFDDPILVQETETSISVLHAADFNFDDYTDIIWSADLSVQPYINPLAIEAMTPRDELAFIYPNPTSEDLYIKSAENGSLTVLNTRGQVVYNRLPITKGKNYLQLNLAPQIYFVNIDLESGEHLTKKLVLH